MKTKITTYWGETFDVRADESEMWIGTHDRCYAICDGYEPGDFIGHGRTEQEAIDDLLLWIEDAHATEELKQTRA